MGALTRAGTVQATATCACAADPVGLQHQESPWRLRSDGVEIEVLLMERQRGNDDEFRVVDQNRMLGKAGKRKRDQAANQLLGTNNQRSKPPTVGKDQDTRHVMKG